MKRSEQTWTISNLIEIENQNLLTSDRVNCLIEEENDFNNALSVWKRKIPNLDTKPFDLPDRITGKTYITSDFDRPFLSQLLTSQETDRILSMKGTPLPRRHADSYIVISRAGPQPTVPKRQKLVAANNGNCFKNGISIRGFFELCPKYNFETCVCQANVQNEIGKAIESQIFNGVRFDIEQLKAYRNKLQDDRNCNAIRGLNCLIRRGESILFHEKTKPEKLSCQSATTSIRRRLDIMKTQDGVDIVGFGSSSNGFTVHITDEGYDTETKDKISEKIKRISSSREKTNVTWIPKLKKFATIGDGLITESRLALYQESGKKSGYGTLGLFCKDPHERLMAATVGHVVNDREMVCFLPDRDPKVLGTCNIHLGNGEDNRADFATVLVKPDIKKTLSVASKNGTPLLIKLCPKNVIASLVNCKVWKRGAKTGYREGVITHADFEFTGDHLPFKRKYIYIESIDEDFVFAKQGDSGSAVFRNIIERRNEAQCLGILLLGDENGPYIIFPLSSAFEEVENNYLLQLCFAQS